MALSVTNLVGFGSKRAAAGGGGDTLTFVGATTNSATGYSVSFHGSAAAGDLAIVFEHFDGTTALLGSTGSAPSGWTVFDDTVTTSLKYTPGGADVQSGFYYKVLSSGDISGGSVSSAITSGADVVQLMACQIWRPSSTPTLSVQEVIQGSLATSPSAASVTSSSGSPIVLVVGHTGGSLMSGESPAFDQPTQVGSSGAGMEVGVTAYSASPSDQSVDDDDSGTLSINIAAYANVSFA